MNAAARQTTAIPASTGSSSFTASNRTWQGGSPRPAPDPQLERRGPEPEVLADLALEVAEVRRRQRPVAEQGERGRVGRALSGVEDAPCGRRVGALRGLDD